MLRSMFLRFDFDLRLYVRKEFFFPVKKVLVRRKRTRRIVFFFYPKVSGGCKGPNFPGTQIAS